MYECCSKASVAVWHWSGTKNRKEKVLFNDKTVQVHDEDGDKIYVKNIIVTYKGKYILNKKWVCSFKVQVNYVYIDRSFLKIWGQPGGLLTSHLSLISHSLIKHIFVILLVLVRTIVKVLSLVAGQTRTNNEWKCLSHTWINLSRILFLLEITDILMCFFMLYTKILINILNIVNNIAKL